jgi:hypothetical protein
LPSGCTSGPAAQYRLAIQGTTSGRISTLAAGKERWQFPEGPYGGFQLRFHLAVVIFGEKHRNHAKHERPCLSPSWVRHRVLFATRALDGIYNTAFYRLKRLVGPRGGRGMGRKDRSAILTAEIAAGTPVLGLPAQPVGCISSSQAYLAAASGAIEGMRIGQWARGNV